MSQDDFFEHLYEPRDVVDQLKSYLEGDSTNLLCLVGPPGSGKSTIVTKLLRDTRHDRRTDSPNRSYMILIDLRVETETNAFDLSDSASIERSLRARLIAAYLDEFFPLTRSGDNPRIKLWAFLLDRSRNNVKPAQIFSVFQRLQDRATGLLRRHDKGHPHEPPILVETWLDKKSEDPEVLAITNEVDALIDFGHLVHAAIHVEGIGKQIVWLDNVDTLTTNQQTDALLAGRKLFTPVAAVIGMGVSIREENVFREYELRDDKSTPYETRVLLEMPRGPGGLPYFPSKDVPVAKDEILRSIINRRLEFTKAYQIHRLHKLREDIAAAEGLSLTADPNLRLAQTQLERLSPQISEQRYANLYVLAAKLLEAMSDERAIFLANNSLRDFMVTFRDCLSDLLKAPEPEEEPVRAMSYERWYLGTLFLRRARHAQRRYKVGVYDVLAATDEWFKRGAVGVGCLLPHMIITVIWNLILDGKTGNSEFARTPSVGDVIARLSLLGFERTEIVEAMHALFLHNWSRQNLIEFRSRDLILFADQIKDDLLVYLTYRGKCIVGRTSSSFGYLYDCLRLLTGGSQDDEMLIDHPAIRSRDDVVESLLPHLCDVAQMHYHALKSIQTRKVFKEAEWPYRYYRFFGVPFVRPYGRKPLLDGTPGSERRFLQLEIMLMSLMIHVKGTRAAEQLQKLLMRFMDAVTLLKKVDNEQPDPDFRKLLGLAPRRKEFTHDDTAELGQA